MSEYLDRTRPSVDAVADRAAAYYQLRKELRRQGTLDDDLDTTLKDQWWADVKGDFGHKPTCRYGLGSPCTCGGVE